MVRRAAFASGWIALALGAAVAFAQPGGAGSSPTASADAALAEAVDRAHEEFDRAQDAALTEWLAAYEKALESAQSAGDQEGVRYLQDAIARSKRAGRAIKPPPADAVTFERNLYALVVTS